MPTGVYKRTEYHRRINSESHKGRRHSKKTKLLLSKILMGNKRSVGRKHSEETKRLMSIAHIGIPKSEEMKKKMSILKRGNKYNLGKGRGLTSLYDRIRTCLKYRLWRSDIYTRDNFTCQMCGDSRGGNLEAHHIKSFSKILQYYEITTIEEALRCEELWNLNNGITLCEECHKNTHNKKEMI